MVIVNGKSEYTLEDVRHIKWMDDSNKIINRYGTARDIVSLVVTILLGTAVAGGVNRVIKDTVDEVNKYTIVIISCLILVAAVWVRAIVQRRVVKTLHTGRKLHGDVAVLAKYKEEKHKVKNGEDITAYPILVENLNNWYETVIYTTKELYEKLKVGDKLMIERDE